MRTAWACASDESSRPAVALRDAAHSPQNFAVGAFSNPHFAHCLLKRAAHSLQNFSPSGFSAPQFEPRIFPPYKSLTRQIVQQCFRLLQVGGFEALGEPAVDLGEHRARFVATALLREQLRETHSRAQFE